MQNKFARHNFAHGARCVRTSRSTGPSPLRAFQFLGHKLTCIEYTGITFSSYKTLSTHLSPPAEEKGRGIAHVTRLSTTPVAPFCTWRSFVTIVGYKDAQ